jgi:predicted DNA-binding ribbon-helix-helix protein
MKSAVRKHSIYINRRKTSVSLEDDFWFGLLEIAVVKKTTVPALVARIDHNRKTVNLSSAIRMFVFRHFKADAKPKTIRRKRRQRILRYRGPTSRSWRSRAKVRSKQRP